MAPPLKLNLIVSKDQQQSIVHVQKKQLEDEEEKDKKATFNIKFEKCPSSANYNKFIGNSNGMFTIESESIFKVRE